LEEEEEEEGGGMEELPWSKFVGLEGFEIKTLEGRGFGVGFGAAEVFSKGDLEGSEGSSSSKGGEDSLGLTSSFGSTSGLG
jgi:hypothetical protein